MTSPSAAVEVVARRPDHARQHFRALGQEVARASGQAQGSVAARGLRIVLASDNNLDDCQDWAEQELEPIGRRHSKLGRAA